MNTDPDTAGRPRATASAGRDLKRRGLLKMAEQGFVALSLDLSFWGESEGKPPRNAVSPDIYAEDFSAAVDYLRTQTYVDKEAIGAIGICGSGSFVISAAEIDPRIKAIATVSMYDMGAANRNGLRHSVTVEQRKDILGQAAQQRDVEFAGGQTEYTSGTPEELNDQSTAIDREFYDFYRTSRGHSPATTTHPTLTSNVKFMNFYHSRTSRRFLLVRCSSSRASRHIPGSSAKRATGLPASPRNW